MRYLKDKSTYQTLINGNLDIKLDELKTHVKEELSCLTSHIYILRDERWIKKFQEYTKKLQNFHRKLTESKISALSFFIPIER